MRSKFLIAAVLLCGSAAIAKPEVKSQRLENNVLILKVDGITGPNFPERVEARVDGKEILKPEMRLSSPTIAVLVDTSIGCQIEKVADSLKPHLAGISKAIPVGSMTTLITYDAEKVQPLPAVRADQFAVDSLKCGPKRSLPLGDLFLKLFQERQNFDLLLAYTSGNIFLDESRAKALSSIAGRSVLVSYLAKKTDLGEYGRGITLFSRESAQPIDQWLPSIEMDVLAGLGVTAEIALPLPASLSSGDYTVDLDLISKGKVASTASARIKYEKARIPIGRAFWIKMAILIVTIGLILTLALYFYYRTPRCHKCGRPKLRKQRVCLFCMQYGDALVEIPVGGRTDVYVVSGRFVVGSDRSADVAVGGPKGSWFAIEREGAIYRLFTNSQKLLCNGKPIRGPRHMRSGDKVSLGGTSCRFYVQKNVA